MKELKDRLIELARSKDICRRGYERMAESDIDGLVDYYVANPDWCMERCFPPIDVLREYFSDIEDRGVFVGRTFHGELLNDLQTYIFHGCRGTIKAGLNVKKGIIPMLYLGNGCRLHIVGTGDVRPRKKNERSTVPIYIFGRNDVSARDNRYVNFTRYKTDLI